MCCGRFHPFLFVCVLMLLASGIVTGTASSALQEESLQDIEQKLQEAPDDVALLLARGALQRHAHDYAGAVGTYEHILKLSPQDKRARNLLVMVLHKAAEGAEGTRTLALLRRAVELAPDAEFLREGYLETLRENACNAELVKAYDALPEGYELSVPMLAAIADAHRKAGKLSDAAALYRAVLAETPADADAGFGLALALLDDGQYPEALDAIQSTLTMYPLRPTLLLALAAVQWKAGTRVLALDTFDHILEIDPDNADAVNLKA